MPSTLELTADGRRLRFTSELRVQELAADGSVKRETAWESVSGEKENEISFRLDGETRTSLAVQYAFNARNQLTLQVVQQDGVPQASDVWTLSGRIIIDDLSDVRYLLLDDAGQASQGRFVEVYATLDFPAGYARLRATMPGGSETFIVGADKHRSLSAGEYVSGGDLARDLLAFSAVTRNTIAGRDKEYDADIRFHGRWDMHENALVFVTDYDRTGAGAPLSYLAIGGQLKSTNVGLVVEQDGKVAFQVSGRYEWNRNTLGFDFKLGHSKAAGLEARLEVKSQIVGKNGTLTIAGAATLMKGAQGVKLDLNLSLAYVADGKNLVFTVTGGAGGYELQLSGNFKIRNSNVKFAVTFNNRNGQKSLTATAEWGVYTQNMMLKGSLEAVLNRNGLTLKGNLEFRFFWGPNGPVAQLP